jgi:FkbM family methyltransferase
LPDVFEQLQRNIKNCLNQSAINALVTDRDDQEYTLYIANNNGASSSIFDLARHREIWPDVHFVSSKTMKSTTLDRILSGVSHNYDALVMDTQGAELLVLKGAAESLMHFKYIKTEAADFESYRSGAQAGDLISYLRAAGFRLIKSVGFARSPKGGQYFELLFERV